MLPEGADYVARQGSQLVAAHHSGPAALIITTKGFKTAFVNNDLHSVRVSGAASIEAKHAPQTFHRASRLTSRTAAHSSWGL